MEKEKVILLILLIILLPSTLAYNFCEETISENELKITEIIDTTQTNNNWEWEPTENITIQVKSTNRNLTTRNFQIELFFIHNDKLQNITIKQENLKQILEIKKTEDSIINFTFKLDEPQKTQYELYAKLTDPNNETICTSLKATSKTEETIINIKEDEKIIVVRNINGPKNITAGSKANYIVSVINLGNIKEERVMVRLYNAKLKIKEEEEIIGLGVEEIKNVTFNITIPKNTTTQQHNFLFSTEYSYNNKTKYYYESSDKSKSFSTQIIANKTTIPKITKNTKNQTQEIQQPNKTSIIKTEDKNSNIYLYLTITTISLILIIIAGAIFFIKHNKNKSTENPEKSKKAIKNYIEKINKPNSTPPSKPSETNTANTKTPPTSQNPPQQPHSPQAPAKPSSSPKPISSKPVSHPPTSPNQPQKNPPSPQSPNPNKTSSP